MKTDVFRSEPRLGSVDLIVVGGGASGMLCAGTAAEQGLQVLLIEKNEKLGRKLNITGKGRCNLTNDRSPEEVLRGMKEAVDEFVKGQESFDDLTMVGFSYHGQNIE